MPVVKVERKVRGKISKIGKIIDCEKWPENEERTCILGLGNRLMIMSYRLLN